MIISDNFPKYTKYDPIVPIWFMTPHESGMHRFFDTSPVSPSGRYLAVLRMPELQRLNRSGEMAEIVLIDIHTAEEQVIAETCGWEQQLGANINWGADDTALYYNDVDCSTWNPHGIRINPFTGEKKRMAGTVYRISPDGKSIISSNLITMRRTQDGYGVVVPDNLVPRNYGFRKDDGLYITDTETGKCKLFISIDEIFEKAQPKIDRKKYEHGECYVFHCKYNPQGDRLIFTLRWYHTLENQPWNVHGRQQLDFWVLTMKPDGSDIYVAVGPEQWKKGGHHINWFPDGEHLSMNLAIDDDQNLKFVQVRYDGSDMRCISDNIPGSGHPTVHPNGRNILTDTYEQEPTAFGDGTVPIRLIDIPSQREKHIVRINVAHPGTKVAGALRVDPHPAWTPDFKHVVFNGYVDGARRVFLADLSEVLG